MTEMINKEYEDDGSEGMRKEKEKKDKKVFLASESIPCVSWMKKGKNKKRRYSDGELVG